MSKAVLGLLVLVVFLPVVQSGSPPRAITTRSVTTQSVEFFVPDDDCPRFFASLDSVRTNDNGGVTATVTLQNFSTQPFYFDDQALPRNVMERIRIWRVDSDKCITFAHNGCLLYSDYGTRQFKKLSRGERHTVTVEYGGNTGEFGNFYESIPEGIPFETPPFKYLPIGRKAVTLPMELYVYSSNPASYADRLRFQKWVVCQSNDLKWLTVTKTWP